MAKLAVVPALGLFRWRLQWLAVVKLWEIPEFWFFASHSLFFLGTIRTGIVHGRDFNASLCAFTGLFVNDAIDFDSTYLVLMFLLCHDGSLKLSNLNVSIYNTYYKPEIFSYCWADMVLLYVRA